MFWCGPPPFCLTMPVGSPERCHIIPGSRNGGANAVRDPEDLRCDVAGVNPTGPTHATPGRCPVVPTLGATINNEQAATVSQGANVTLRINTASATPLSTPTSLTMACTGTNAGINPFNRTNLDSIAGQDHTYPAVVAVNAGSTSCTITASNAAGTVTYQVSFNATPTVVTPRPTISASFDPNRNFTAGSAIWLNLRATNATQVRWSCSGRWNHNNQAITVGRTRHTTPRNAGTTNCTFTATGPGGTASTTASWTSGGSGGGETPPPVYLTVGTTHKVYSSTHGDSCSYAAPTYFNPYSPPPRWYSGWNMQGRVTAGGATLRVVSGDRVEVRDWAGRGPLCTTRIPAPGAITTCARSGGSSFTLRASIGNTGSALVGNAAFFGTGDSACIGG